MSRPTARLVFSNDEPSVMIGLLAWFIPKMSTTTPIHNFGERTPQDTKSSVKVTPPPEVYDFGILVKNRLAFVGYDPVAEIPVLGKSYDHLENVYGDTRERKDPRIFDRKIEKTGAMSIPIELTAYCQHGVDVGVINFERDDPLAFFAFGPMLKGENKTIYMATRKEYEKLLKDPTNRFRATPQSKAEAQEGYIEVLWESEVELHSRRPGGGGTVRQIAIRNGPSLSAVTHLDQAAVEGCLFGRGPKADAYPDRLTRQI